VGKKPQRHVWPEAKKLCRLNQSDIAMAKRLGFRPEGLIRNRPDTKQKWKLPVKSWIRELHLERFGYVLGENSSLPTVQALPIKYSEEEARIYGEERYREEYCERNEPWIEAPKPPRRKS
jgi:hypothetical protein